jgi:cytochrome c-type biogenesis protein CcmF
VDVQALGQLSILAALVMNLVAGGAYFLQARGNRKVGHLAEKSYHFFVLFTAIASVLLYYLFFSHDYRFTYVYQYSQREQPFLYILSAFWGGQEGTYLLWVLFTALFGYLIIRHGRHYRDYAMAVYALVNAFFLLILTKLSPFAYLGFAAPDGAGLNPLLRDPWMVIHPPIMFVGYAMAAVPFVFAMAALIKNDFKDWLKIAFPWTAVTSVMLGAGNVLGAFWAYKTLGWGGFWGWDPVENSSFVPWVISLALLHGMILERRSGAFRRINLLLASFLFLLVVYGTFLTRSGVLSDFSVHSFTDLGINVYLVGFMILFVVLTAVLFAWRAKGIVSASLSYNIYGREFALFGGLLLLFVTGVVVLFWSSLPVLTGVFSSEPRAADVATYNNFALPLAILYSLLLAYSPFSTYADTQFRPGILTVVIAFTVSGALGFGLIFGLLGQTLQTALLFTAVAGGLALFFIRPGVLPKLVPAVAALILTIGLGWAFGIADYLNLIFFVAASMAIASNISAFVSHAGSGLKVVGGHLTHIGFGLMLIGILASSAYDESEKLVLDRDTGGTAFATTIAYRGMENEITHANNRLILDIGDSATMQTFFPELYYSERMNGFMKKPAIKRRLLGDLYMAPEQIIPNTDQSTLLLKKGSTVARAGISFTFLSFELPDHGETSDGFRVAAQVAVAHGDVVDTIAPGVIQRIGGDGQLELEDQSVLFGADGSMYEVFLASIQADKGEVTLEIPALADSGAPDKLVLDVSYKPLINLVWAGSLLILLGTVVVFFRRFGEMIHTAGTEAA